jgi:VIT1/CCC1 family predicted Fe2+/Mn2+ transporter
MKAWERIVVFAAAAGLVLGVLLLAGAFFVPLVRSFGFGEVSGTPYAVTGAGLLLGSSAAVVGLTKRRSRGRQAIGP